MASGDSVRSTQGQDVKLIKLRTLGVGSYGAVHVARYGDLTCAAKIMHLTLFQYTPKGKPPLVERFDQECELLRSIRHPCIVQFLDKATDPDSGLPVLLMELMDESLTHFLDKSDQPPLYHLQVNIFHDIAAALSYIHSRGFIHRDVSSNNVLLVAGACKAKLSDFGVSTLVETNQAMTQCPGSTVYMAPECIEEGQYSVQIDIFSLGVIGIQIATCQFPQPGNPFGKAPVPIGMSSPSPLMRRIPEVERRQNHIHLISGHRLLKTFLSCIEDLPEERPSAHEICELLYKHKESTVYVESVQNSKSRDNSSLQAKCTALTHRVQELTDVQGRLQVELDASQSAAQRFSAEADDQRRIASSLQRDIEKLRETQSSQQGLPASTSHSARGFFGGLFKSRAIPMEFEQRLRQAEQERRQAVEERDAALLQRDETLAESHEIRRMVISIKDELEWKDSRLREKENQYTRALRKYDDLEVEYNRKSNLLREVENRLEQKTTKLDNAADALERRQEEVASLRQQVKEKQEVIENVSLELEAERRQSSHRQQTSAAADQSSLESIMKYIRQTSDEQIQRLKQQLLEKERELEASHQRAAELQLALISLEEKLGTSSMGVVSGESRPSIDDEEYCNVCKKSIVSEVYITVQDCCHILCKSCVLDVLKESGDQPACPVSVELSLCSALIPETAIHSVLDPEEIEALHRSRDEPDQASSIPCLDSACGGHYSNHERVDVFWCSVCHQMNCLVCQAVHSEGYCPLSEKGQATAVSKDTLSYSPHVDPRRHDLCPLESIPESTDYKSYNSDGPVREKSTPGTNEDVSNLAAFNEDLTLNSEDLSEFLRMYPSVVSNSTSVSRVPSLDESEQTLHMSLSSLEALRSMFPAACVSQEETEPNNPSSATAESAMESATESKSTAELPEEEVKTKFPTTDTSTNNGVPEDGMPSIGPERDGFKFLQPEESQSPAPKGLSSVQHLEKMQASASASASKPIDREPQPDIDSWPAKKSYYPEDATTGEEQVSPRQHPVSSTERLPTEKRTKSHQTIRSESWQEKSTQPREPDPRITSSLSGITKPGYAPEIPNDPAYTTRRVYPPSSVYPQPEPPGSLQFDSWGAAPMSLYPTRPTVRTAPIYNIIQGPLPSHAGYPSDYDPYQAFGPHVAYPSTQDYIPPHPSLPYPVDPYYPPPLPTGYGRRPHPHTVSHPLQPSLPYDPYRRTRLHPLVRSEGGPPHGPMQRPLVDAHGTHYSPQDELNSLAYPRPSNQQPSMGGYQPPHSYPTFQSDDKLLVNYLQSSDRQPDEYLAVLMRQSHIEDANQSWKVVFTICMRNPCYVESLQEKLKVQYGERFEMAFFCIKFKDAVILRFPTEDMRQQGYSFAADVSLCKITKDEVRPPEGLDSATPTYPPRHMLTISPILPVSRRRELMVNLTLEGVEACDNQQEFILKAPPLIPKSHQRNITPPPAAKQQPPEEQAWERRLQSEPKTNTVSVLIAQYIEQRWWAFAQLLGVPFDQIQKIRTESAGVHDHTKHCFCDAVEYWRTHTMQPTWAKIINALQTMKEVKSAATVRHYLKTSPPENV